MAQPLVLWVTIVQTGQYQRPDMETPGEITSLLHAWAKGDQKVEGQLFELVMPDLHKIAACLMRRERPGHTLQATELLNETYCKLIMARERDWQNRRHFFAIA